MMYHLTSIAILSLLALPVSAEAQMISGNAGNRGGSVGLQGGGAHSNLNQRTYGSSGSSSGLRTSPGYGYYQSGPSSPVGTIYRYGTRSHTRESARDNRASERYNQQIQSQRSAYRQQPSSFSNYPAYYNTGYSYPANHYGNYQYSGYGY